MGSLGFAAFDDDAARLLDRAAREANAIPCVMPMRSDPHGPDLIPAVAGWGLVDARDCTPVNPAALVDDELVVMTDWELLDFAILVVRTYIDHGGGHVVSWQSTTGVDPAMWFREEGVESYVVVRCSRYPNANPRPPHNLAELTAHIRRRTTARG
jgi:hypothetical protein